MVRDLWSWRMICDLFVVSCDLWLGICELCHVVCDKWDVMCDLRAVSFDLWYHTCDYRLVDCLLWHVTCDLYFVAWAAWLVYLVLLCCSCPSCGMPLTHISIIFWTRPSTTPSSMTTRTNSKFNFFKLHLQTTSIYNYLQGFYFKNKESGNSDEVKVGHVR